MDNSSGKALIGCSSNSTPSSTSQPASPPSAQEKAPEIYANPKVATPDEALALLKEGNQRFVGGTLANYDLGQAKIEELAKGQAPFAIVVTCSDSRVTPEHVFDQGLGDIFVVRVAGNVLDAHQIGSVEFAAEVLGAKAIVMMGHESCGAVKSAVQASEGNLEVTENIDAILDSIQPAVAKAKASSVDKDALVEVATDENVKYTVEQLKEASPLLNEKITNGTVKVVAAKYLLKDGSVKWFE